MIFRVGLIAILFTVPFASAQTDVYTPDAQEILRLIRKDKLDLMWIIIDKGRGTEPLFRDFGNATSNGNGIFVFTDRGGERIEKAVLGGHSDMIEACGAYDIIGDPDDLTAFVAERDTQRIGVNMTTAEEIWPPESRHLGDGLSHTDYLILSVSKK